MFKKNWEFVLHKKGTLCYRCGMNKKEAKGWGCSHYGKAFDTHMWNKEDMKVKTYFIKTS